MPRLRSILLNKVLGRLAALVALSLVGGAAQSLEGAVIVMPPSAASCEAAGCAASTTSAARLAFPGEPVELVQQWKHHTAGPSTSPPSQLAGSGGVLAVGLVSDAVDLTGGVVFQRLAGERRLALPSPPRSSLFRPPKA